MTVLRVLDDGTVRGLGDGDLRAVDVSGPVYADLIGSTSLGIDASGGLIGIAALAGHVPVSFALSGVFFDPGAMVGNTVMSITASGVASGDAALIGDTGLSIAAAGTLSGIAGLAGNTGVAFTITGPLTADVWLTGSTGLTFAVTGQPSAASAPSRPEPLWRLLVDIATPDAAAQPAPAPRASASWVPTTYIAGGTPAPTAFTVSPWVDQVTLRWTPAPGNLATVIERAPDVFGAPGVFAQIWRGIAQEQTISAASEVTFWYRVATIRNGIYSAYSPAVGVAALNADKVLLPAQKPQVIADYNQIINDQAGIEAQATAAGITAELVTYDAAVTALIAYLATLTTPVLWSNLTSYTTAIGATVRTKFLDAWIARQSLLNAITGNIQITIGDIASDNVLTPGEKPTVIKERDALVAEQAGIDAQAAAVAITTEKATYDAAVTALTTYLATLTAPVLWSSLAGKTTIVGATFRTKFLDVYAARQTLLNKIASQLKTLAEVANYVINGGFENDQDQWTQFDSGWSTEVNAIALTGTKVAKKSGGASAARIVNAGRVAASAGKRLVAVANVRSASATGTIGPGIMWFNQSGTAFAVSESTYLAPGAAAGVWKQVRFAGIAPPNTAYGSVTVLTSGYSTGTWYVDSCDIEIPPQDQTGLPPVGVGSVGSRWDGLSLSYSIPSTGSPATVTVIASAATLRAGSVSVSYNASSSSVSQARSTTVTYFVYYLDASYAGGARSLNVTTDPNNLANADEVVWVGSVDVVCPAVGTTGSGTGDRGGGCVDISMWVDAGRFLMDVQLGDELDCPVYDTTPWIERRRVRKNTITVQPCWRIVTESGAAVVASDSTPMTLRDGSVCSMPDMLGRAALVRAGADLRWERVVLCYFFGNRPTMHVNVFDTCYFAGECPGLQIATHNATYKP